MCLPGITDIMVIIHIMIITGILTITKKGISPNAQIFPVVIITEEIDATETINTLAIKNLPVMILIMGAEMLVEEIQVSIVIAVEVPLEEMR